MIKTALIALAILAACGSPAVAIDVSKDAVAAKLNQLCRGLSGDTAHLDDICEARDRAFKVAEGLGYCYGKQDQIGADHRWHKCVVDSNRPSRENSTPSGKVVKQLPAKMTGEWCFKDVNQTKENHYTAGKCKGEDSDGNIVLSSTRFKLHETACNINQIKEVFKDSETYFVEMRCSGEGETWRERVQVRFQGHPSLLFTKQLWRSK